MTALLGPAGTRVTDPHQDRSAHVVAAHLAPVGLEELTTHADLLTRVDRKYVLPLTDVVRFLELLGGARVLEIDGERSFDYESVYFDTPDLVAYRQAAHRRPRRFKVRTRTYHDSGTCWLEVKTRDRRGRTVKRRQQHAPEDRHHLGDGEPFATRVVREAGAIPPSTATLDLHPALITRYDRTTVWLPDDGARLTVDTRLRCDDGQHAAELTGRAVVETKTAGRPSRADRLLWSAGHRPTRISKYATGLAALDPTLPAARWRPVLRRHPFLPVAEGTDEPARERPSTNPIPYQPTHPMTSGRTAAENRRDR